MTPAKKIPNNKPEEKKILTLVDKTDNPSDKDPKLNIEDLLTRIGIYSVNIGSRLLCEAYKAKESIGNFYGALGFATLDVLARKNSKFKRLTKFGGYLFYVGSCGYDLISGLNDWENLWPHLGNFALDVTMAYQLGKDMGGLYKELESKSKEKKKFGISRDLEGIVNFFKEKFKKEDKVSEKDSKSSEKEKDKSSETIITDKKTGNSKLKEYLSTFGKAIGQGVSFGAFAGYSFGYSAFENLKENYSVYKIKQKEKKELKKIKDEEIKKQKAEQKIKEQEEKEIKNALEKIRKANKKKMKTREDEVSLIKYGGATLEDLKNRDEKGKSRYDI